MVTAASQRDAVSPTMGHRVVVKGPGNSAMEKGLARARDEEKEKGKTKEKVEEAGHPEIHR